MAGAGVCSVALQHYASRFVGEMALVRVSAPPQQGEPGQPVGGELLKAGPYVRVCFQLNLSSF